MIRALGVGFKISGKKIREEKNLQDREHNEQFEENDLPQGLPDNHRAETVIVEVKSISEQNSTAFPGHLPMPIETNPVTFTPGESFSQDKI